MTETPPNNDSGADIQISRSEQPVPEPVASASGFLDRLKALTGWRKSGMKEVDTDGLRPSATPEEAMLRTNNLFVREYLLERQSERKWRRFKKIGISGFFLLFVFYYVALTYVVSGSPSLFPSSDKVVGVVSITGPISASAGASADNVIPALTTAFEDKRVQAVVISIDSPGGAPVESERIINAIRSLKAKNGGKEVVTVIHNLGASAAYMIAMQGDRVVAGRYSLVGSIGAVMQGWDLHKVLERFDVKQKTFASGEFKTMLNPFAPPNADADRKAQELIDSVGGQFREDVLASRKDKLIAGFKYDTGEVWNGVKAKEIGLVDELGTVETVVGKFEGLEAKSFGPYKQKTLMERIGATFGAVVGADLAQAWGTFLSAFTGQGTSSGLN